MSILDIDNIDAVVVLEKRCPLILEAEIMKKIRSKKINVMNPGIPISAR